MVIYEVNLSVQPEIQAEFEAWVTPHVQEVLQFEGFLKAEWFVTELLLDDSGPLKNYTIHYHVSEEKFLHDYLMNHAERMREDAKRRFPGQYTAHRRLLKLKESLASVELATGQSEV